jgi:hypothetical protein
VVVSLVRYLWEEVHVVLYGVVVAVVWCTTFVGALVLYQGSSLSVFSCEEELVHGLIVLSERIYLRKVGWVFPRVWGFPRITLVSSCACLCCSYFQYMVYG